MKLYLTALTWILIIGSSGCQNASNSNQSSKHLISTNWTFLGLQHDDTKMYETIPPELAGMNIVFDSSHTFQANSSCNTVYGSFSIVEKNSLKIDSVSMTKMFCMDSIQIVWEDKYISGLKSTVGFKITNDTLSILTNSNIEMIFKGE